MEQMKSIEIAEHFARRYFLKTGDNPNISYYNILGNICAFICNDPFIAESTRVSLNHYLIQYTPRRIPDAALTLVCVEDLNDMPRFLISPDKTNAKDGIGIIDRYTNNSLFVLGYKHKRSIIFIKKSHVLYWAACFVPGLLACALFPDKLVVLHCACIYKDNKGISFIGESSTGKSTLSYLSLKYGYEIISDDACFISNDNDHINFTAFLRELHIHPKAIDYFPMLHKNISTLKLGYDLSGKYKDMGRERLHKYRISLKDVGMINSKISVHADAIVFPRIDTKNESYLAKISSDEALLRMAALKPMFCPYPGWTFLPDSQYHLYYECISSLIKNTQAYEAVSGLNPHRIIDELNTLFFS